MAPKAQNTQCMPAGGSSNQPTRRLPTRPQDLVQARLLYIMPAMPRYRPLTSEQLRAIYEANPTPAVKRLLWEIHRLRASVLRADDFVRALERHKGESRLDPGSGIALTSLREALREEPVVKEEAARRLHT
jgi:hypothetical protein